MVWSHRHGGPKVGPPVKVATPSKPKKAATMTADETERKSKRAAERQITKDDREEGDNNDDHVEPSIGFPKADEETLKKRRIVKVKHPEKNDDGNEKKKSSNPFANLSKNSASVFGSGYGGGFGATAGTGSGGFSFGGGSFSAGSGFPTSPQGANSSTASVFGSSTAFSGGIPSAASSESGFGTTASSAKSEQQLQSPFPDQVELKTGEEDEECILTIRAKSFLLVEKEEIKTIKQVDEGSAHSVPPSSSNVSAADASQENGDKPEKGSTAADVEQAQSNDEPKNSQEDSNKKEMVLAAAKEEEKTDTQDGQKKSDEEDTKKKKQQDWRELGIGPLRILKKDKEHTRVVQRRESAPGGAGTKLLVNAPLIKESKVGRLSDQHVRFTTIEPSGNAAVYLLKVKTKAEASQLQSLLEKEIAHAASVGI